MRLMTLKNNTITLKDSFWDNLSLQTFLGQLVTFRVKGPARVF